jgi:chromate transporter
MALLAELFLRFALLACIAFGGATALLPEMRRVVVDQQHWLDDTTFTHLYAIAQAAPGPNGQVVGLVGWEVAGLPGALVATLGLCLPMSLVVFFLMRHWQRFVGTPWQRAVDIGVAPLAVGLVFAAGFMIGQAAGFAWGGVALAGLTVVLQQRLRNLHPLWLIALGAVAGLAGWV